LIGSAIASAATQFALQQGASFLGKAFSGNSSREVNAGSSFDADASKPLSSDAQQAIRVVRKKKSSAKKSNAKKGQTKPTKQRKRNPSRLVGAALGFGASLALSSVAKMPFSHPATKIVASSAVDLGLLFGANALQRWIGYDPSYNTGLKWGAAIGLLVSVAKVVKEHDSAKNSEMPE